MSDIVLVHSNPRASQFLFRMVKTSFRHREWDRILAYYSRLTSYQLPSSWGIGVLVEEYFNNIHPLRCFAFIHRPSFLQRLDTEDTRRNKNSALLYMICALGAQWVSTHCYIKGHCTEPGIQIPRISIWRECDLYFSQGDSPCREPMGKTGTATDSWNTRNCHNRQSYGTRVDVSSHFKEYSNTR